MENTIIFATGNENKMREIRMILEGSGLRAISLKEAGIEAHVDENGDTFAQNAFLKANAVCTLTGKAAMADDSGLVVDELNGEPGIYSARYLGEDTSYLIKNTALVRRLDKIPGARRTARFVCAICCVFPDGTVLRAEDTMEGIIAHEAAGKNGFGYDPILYLPYYGCTSAQLPPDEKNRISHRGKALRAMRELLVEKLGQVSS